MCDALRSYMLPQVVVHLILSYFIDVYVDINRMMSKCQFIYINYGFCNIYLLNTNCPRFFVSFIFIYLN